jgi:hypothetical protein
VALGVIGGLIRTLVAPVLGCEERLGIVNSGIDSGNQDCATGYSFLLELASTDPVDVPSVGDPTRRTIRARALATCAGEI